MSHVFPRFFAVLHVYAFSYVPYCERARAATASQFLSSEKDITRTNGERSSVSKVVNKEANVEYTHKLGTC